MKAIVKAFRFVVEVGKGIVTICLAYACLQFLYSVYEEEKRDRERRKKPFAHTSSPYDKQPIRSK